MKIFDSSTLKSFEIDKKEILKDYGIAFLSRQLSLLGRKEVLSGKAKFGIFGDGKELPQLAMAKVFKKGDWRSGYYRDQTFMFATGMMKYEEFFAQLYGDVNSKFNPATSGRLMNNHFATHTVDEYGNWLDQIKLKNSAADTSPTASQMPRLLGLAYASKVYRNLVGFKNAFKFSNNGNEIAFGTIGDASTSEGHFFETINAAGVLQIPLAISIWDDGWGISVPKIHQTTKQSISEVLIGFESDENENGFLIYKAKGWDYPALVEMYKEGTEQCRNKHIPVIFHITELTQPQGHSTSGSHERYKTTKQLNWEKKHDGLVKIKEWILKEGISTENDLKNLEEDIKSNANEIKTKAWLNFQNPILKKRKEFLNMVNITTCNCTKKEKIIQIKNELAKISEPIRKDIISSARKILRLICDSCSNPKNSLKKNVYGWLSKQIQEEYEHYSSHLYSESKWSALNIKEIKPKYDKKGGERVPGREILRRNFDCIFSKYPECLIFGEDVGRMGGVNLSMEGLQKKYGENRIFDTGVREATIIGQGLGMALRGLRPIVEIQYFDYLLYGLQVLSDDVATLLYRTKGKQKAPLIISTRGHRLEGIWHSGSPLSMVINSIRGIYVLVPRNMTQAAGFYNTILESDNPALIIEPLNAYRIRENFPLNIGEHKTPIGKPEILLYGNDITIVTYGSCVRIAKDACVQLKEFNIDVELIDVQSLIPFDIDQMISKSLEKTNKVVFFDEDVPGGATAYMMQKVIEEQKGYHYLDSAPKTLSAKAHRAAYSTDGDYFSNPNTEDVFETVYNIMHEYNPVKYPKIF